jgi:hypothetical protein
MIHQLTHLGLRGSMGGVLQNSATSCRNCSIEPQEIAFGFLYSFCAFRLFGSWDSLGFLVLLLGLWTLAVVDRNTQSHALYWLRLLFPILTMPFVYAQVAKVAAITGSRASLLQTADSMLLGGNLSVEFQHFAHPAFTEALAICYIGFFPLVLGAVWVHCGSGIISGQFVLRLLGCLYGLGFLGYCIVPAAGPYCELAGSFSTPLSGWFFTDMYMAMMEWGSNRVDCFPSLHCAISGAVLAADWRFSRRRFRWMLLPVVYLRQHYVIDVVCGAVLLFVIIQIVRRWPSRIEEWNPPFRLSP